MRRRFAFAGVLFVTFCHFGSFCPTAAREQATAHRQEHNFPFRLINIAVAASGGSFWICGTDETIAVSPDEGAHWSVKQQAPGGRVLLLIAFANDKFGYAAGTGGLLLTTEDAGDSWVERSAGGESILQASFADTQHGLIRTPESLLFTDDGTHWTDVSSKTNSEDLKRFPFSFSLIALDSTHMAVMLKRGSAQ